MPPASIPICPQCRAQQCRRSRWLSHDEKAKHVGQRPFRCLKCQHRFLARDPARQQWVRLGLLSLTATLLAVGVLAAAVYYAHQAQQAYVPAQRLVAATPEVQDDTRSAAQSGNTEAQFRLGRSLFLEGTTDRTKAVEALRWLHQAADNGHPEAMVYLGRVYRSGVGAPQNYAHAAKFMTLAAHAGHPDAMLELGRLHRDGIGQPRDVVQAYVWLNRAAAAFHQEAIRERDELHRYLTPEQLHDAQHRSLQPHHPSPPEHAPADSAPTAAPGT